MAHIFICDRCGKKVPTDRSSLGFKDRVQFLGVIMRGIDVRVDLCRECYNDFLNWYHKKGAVLGGDDQNVEKRDETGD